MKIYRRIILFCLGLCIITCSKNNDNEETQKQNQAPSAFDLITIENQAADIVVLPSFSWETATDPDGDTVTYDFFLDTNTNPNTKLGSNLTATTYTISSALEAGTTYFWKVIAKDSNGSSTTSQTNTFSTMATAENGAPEVFDLLTLENESIDVALAPSFTWQPAIDPDGDSVAYDLFLDLEADPQTKVGENLDTASFILTNDLLNSTTYYWKVIAKDENNNSTTSQIFSFTTLANSPPSDFDLISIENGGTSVDLSPTLTWQESFDDDGVVYDIYFGLDTEPTLLEQNIAATTYEVSEPLFLNQKYNWKIIAKDSMGNATESDVFSFTTRGLNLSPTPLTAAAGFSPRGWHTSVVFNNKMWVIGGYNGDGTINGGIDFLNDVWSSTDGINWTLETANAGFSGRYDHTSIVYDNKIWVIGGKAFDTPGIASNAPFRDLNEVWNSTDGINWTLVTANAPFSRRGGHTLDIKNGKLYLLSGGFNSFGTEEVWSTTNGVSWTLETDDLDFNTSARHNHRTVKLNDTFYMTGGARVDYDKIWKSTDYTNWTLVKDELDFLARRAPSFHNYNSNLLYFAGLEPNKSSTTPSAYRQDIWYSIDGENWSQGLEQAPYLERYQHTSVIFEGKIYMIGGQNTNGYLNDVWLFD